jgi:hypothetical protein
MIGYIHEYYKLDLILILHEIRGAIRAIDIRI